MKTESIRKFIEAGRAMFTSHGILAVESVTSPSDVLQTAIIHTRKTFLLELLLHPEELRQVREFALVENFEALAAGVMILGQHLGYVIQKKQLPRSSRMYLVYVKGSSETPRLETDIATLKEQLGWKPAVAPPAKIGNVMVIAATPLKAAIEASVSAVLELHSDFPRAWQGDLCMAIKTYSEKLEERKGLGKDGLDSAWHGAMTAAPKELKTEWLKTAFNTYKRVTLG